MIEIREVLLHLWSIICANPEKTIDLILIGTLGLATAFCMYLLGTLFKSIFSIWS